MSASPLMSIGMRAMAANYAALQTTGHNIANANVEGYSRQQVELATAKGQFTGAGFFGKGVDVQTVTRSHNEFLTREARATRSARRHGRGPAASAAAARGVFRPGEQGVGYAAGQFLNSMVDLASRPPDSSTRQVVLARAADWPTRFAAAGAQLDAVQDGVTAGPEVRRSPTVNRTRAAASPSVNEQIAALRGVGQPANDLLDEREHLISAAQRIWSRSTHHAGRRRHARRLHRRRPAPRAGQARRRSSRRARPARPVALARSAIVDSGGWRAHRRRAGSAAARSPACCGSRTTTWPSRATSSARLAAALARRREPAAGARPGPAHPPGSGAAIFAVGGAAGLGRADATSVTPPATSLATSR